MGLFWPPAPATHAEMTISETEEVLAAAQALCAEDIGLAPEVLASEIAQRAGHDPDRIVAILLGLKAAKVVRLRRSGGGVTDHSFVICFSKNEDP